MGVIFGLIACVMLSLQRSLRLILLVDLLSQERGSRSHLLTIRCMFCRCKTLSDAADGYARAEAVSALILTDMRNAHNGESPDFASKDALCTMRGSAAGQDGRSSALTAPNGPAQQEVLRAALAAAGQLPELMTALQVSHLLC